MEQIAITRFRSPNDYLVNNSIGVEGCRYLANAHWKNLKKLNLSIFIMFRGKYNRSGRMQICFAGSMVFSRIGELKFNNNNLVSNNIGAKGCKYLSQAQWSNLQRLNLGNNCIT